MSIRFTIEQLKKIPVWEINPDLRQEFPENGKKKAKNGIKGPEKISVEKLWMQLELNKWCMAKQLKLDTEYKFHPKRKWRADWAILDKKILIEYEGLFSKKSRHTTPTGFTGDTKKYNSAQALGFKVLRFTAMNYTTVIEELQKNL